MKAALTGTLAGFFEAHNRGDLRNLGDLFTPEALVTDEERTYRRPAEITAWLESALAKYQPQAEPVNCTVDGAARPSQPP